MSHVRARIRGDGQMRDAAVYLDVKGRQRSARIYATEAQATRAWQKAEEKTACLGVTGSNPAEGTIEEHIQRPARVAGPPAMMTSSVRGPWTPATRMSSMSLVALGPLIHVCGRVGTTAATPSGTAATI